MNHELENQGLQWVKLFPLAAADGVKGGCTARSNLNTNACS